MVTATLDSSSSSDPRTGADPDAESLPNASTVGLERNGQRAAEQSATRRRDVRELLVMTVVLAGLAALVHRAIGRDWRVPFVHAGDAMPHLALLETVGWTGTPAPSTTLGAPHGVDWADMPTGADRLHLIVLRALRALAGGDVVVATNVYLLVAIVASGLAAFVVLRRLRCSPLASGVAAAIFAVAPAQFARAGVGHLFLANYAAVPLAVWLTLWASGALEPTDTRSPGRRRWIAPTLGVVVLGSAGVYYALFGAVAIASVGLLRAARTGSMAEALRRARRPLLTAGGTVVVVVANVAGEAARRGGDAGVRVPLDSDAYGLRVAQMLVPVRDHRIGALADWADGAFRVAAPGDRGAALGAASLVGLVAVLGWCLRRIGRPGSAGPTGLLDSGVPGRSGVLSRLGALVVSVVAFAAVGGLGMVVATLGLTQVRAWSRMAIFVGFVGVVGLAMLLDGIARRWRPSSMLQVTGAVALVAFALFDQWGSSTLPPPSHGAERWAADYELADDLRNQLGDGAMVFQLPVGTYPAELPLGSIGANDLLGPAVASQGSLRWSVGAMSGRGGDWQRSLAAQEPGTMIEELAAAGFGAVAVDRRAFDDEGEQIEEALRDRLGPPSFVTGDGTRAWYDLRPLRRDLVERDGDATVAERGAAAVRPLGVVVEGSPGVRSTRDARARHLGPVAAVVVTDESAGSAGADPTAPVTVRFTLTGAAGSSVRWSVPGGDTGTLGMTGEPVELAAQLVPSPDGVARLELRTDAPPLPSPVDDWGDLRLLLGDLSVRDGSLD